MEHPSAHRLGALAWLLVPIYFVAEAIGVAAIAMTGSAPYSLVDNVISDLGAATCTSIPYPYGDTPVCSPAHLVVGIGFALTGLLITAGALALGAAARPRLLGRAALVLWVIVGLACVGSAVPLDVNLTAHTLLSLPMVLQGPALWCTAGSLRHTAPHLARIGRILAAVTVIGSVAMPAVSISGTWIGLWQRLSVWPGYAWLGAIGLRLVRTRSPRGASG